MSIKKEYCDLIKSKHKVYEFRTKLPKKLPVKKIYVYEMIPISSLKYILIVDTPIVFPNKVTMDGTFGVSQFNLGNTKNKIAYPIVSMFELEKPITKNELYQKYGMVPPQSFVYIDTYEQLKHDIDTSKLIKIF